MKNSVRITSGILKGRNLKFYPNEYLRPTKNIVVEALGSILSSEYQDSKCLDLFCGSGLLGFHFYSWGASHVTLVDNNKQTIKELQKQITHLKCQDYMKSYCTDIHSFMDKDKKNYDIVYLDPPYQMYDAESYTENLKPIIEKLTDKANIICIEKPYKTVVDLEFLENTFNLKDYKYGSSSLIIAKKS